VEIANLPLGGGVQEGYIRKNWTYKELYIGIMLWQIEDWKVLIDSIGNRNAIYWYLSFSSSLVSVCLHVLYMYISSQFLHSAFLR